MSLIWRLVRMRILRLVRHLLLRARLSSAFTEWGLPPIWSLGCPRDSPRFWSSESSCAWCGDAFVTNRIKKRKIPRPNQKANSSVHSNQYGRTTKALCFNCLITELLDDYFKKSFEIYILTTNVISGCHYWIDT